MTSLASLSVYRWLSIHKQVKSRNTQPPKTISRNKSLTLSINDIFTQNHICYLKNSPFSFVIPSLTNFSTALTVFTVCNFSLLFSSSSPSLCVVYWIGLRNISLCSMLDKLTRSIVWKGQCNVTSVRFGLCHKRGRAGLQKHADLPKTRCAIFNPS